MPEEPALARHARQTRVVVVGGGIAGLVAARECAKVGLAVTLVESSDRLGGTIAHAEVDGIRVDTGADRWAASSPEMRALISDVGLDAEAVAPAPGARWISGLPSGAAPLPALSVLGIPANPWGDEARRFIGWAGAWRAYLDRLRPPLTIGHEQSLGDLARTRMGARVVDLMVAPLSRGTFGVAPDDVDVGIAAPGLSTALTRTGSLAAAVAELAADAPEVPVRSLRGGLHALVDAIETQLRELGAAVRVGTRATAITTRDGGGWRVAVTGEDPATDEPESLDADIVIVAADGPGARRLLASAVPLPEWDGGDAIDVVTMIVDAPALDDAPRGHEVHARDGSASAVQADAVWTWLRARLPGGTHLLRVTLPSRAEAGADRTGDALAAAARLYDLDPAALDVRDAVTVRRWRAEPASVRGHRARADEVRAAVAARRGVAVVGAWLAGSGLARTVADSIAEADRVRSDALWRGTDIDA
ncbi:protoporphyrinogen/coproporphyrinogen oxidase [Microbacterium sp.]|uniref:protoporphyrinogen/coproporphyrinogen oxidase n=1 Tax=Microbacterium sp. TaxID=51671 RepID=UPI003A8610C1